MKHYLSMTGLILHAEGLLCGQAYNLNDVCWVQAWERICEASRREFQLIYDRLGVEIQERGESFYNTLLAPLVQELMDLGVAIKSDGAKVCSSLWSIAKVF